MPPTLSCAVRTFLQCFLSKIAPATVWRASQPDYRLRAQHGRQQMGTSPHSARALCPTPDIQAAQLAAQCGPATCQALGNHMQAHAMLDTRGHTPHVRTQRLLGSDAQVWTHPSAASRAAASRTGTGSRVFAIACEGLSLRHKGALAGALASQMWARQCQAMAPVKSRPKAEYRPAVAA